MAVPDYRTPPGADAPGATAQSGEVPADPVWIYYFDGRPLAINCAPCGYSLSEWRTGGKEFFKRVFTAESIERMRAATRQVRDSAQPLHNVEVVVQGNGRDRLYHFLVNYHPVADAAGAIIGIRGDARDITDLRTLQMRPGQDAVLLANLIQNTPDLLWIFYLNHAPGYANRGFAGYDARQWANGGSEWFRDQLTADGRRRFDHAVNYLVQSGESVRNLELELPTPNEPRRAHRILATLTPTFNLGGAVEGVHAIVHDITELTVTRAALRKSESHFQDLIESAHDLVWTVDRNGCWTYLNQAARQFYGVEPTELIGRAFIEITHPDHRELDRQIFEEVLRGRDVTQHETTHLHRDGGIRHLSFNIRPQLDENWEVIGAMGIARDITQQKLYQQQLEHLADHDVLTGLHNRHYFENQLDRAVARIARDGRPAGLLYIDIDNFKYVNDTLGHTAGDHLLLQVAQMLLNRLRQGDVLARFGGDEFTVLLNSVPESLLAYVAQSYQKLFEGFTFVQEERVFDIRVSVGAVLLTADTAAPGEALAQADLACTLAKSRGRNQAHVYDVADEALASMVSDVSWTRKINEALAQDHFVLYYQPVVRVRDGMLSHHEVLLRMREPNGTVIAPGLFLPAAERFGLIHAIDRWVISRAIRELAQHQQNGNSARFAVNLSGRVFEDSDFMQFLRTEIDQAGLAPARLTFEVTETAAISHMASAKEFIDQIKLLGCQVALDDFGSGFSSYGYLKHLPVDYLKIDGSFVQQLAQEAIDQAIVRSMNQVAHALGKQTIAEFVEDQTTLELLKSYGVDYAQGYYLGKPAERFDSND